MTDRREFLKVMGSALGCALLAGCGGGGGGPSAGTGGGGAVTGGGGTYSLPSGFRFTPVVRNGDLLTNGLSVVGNLVKKANTRAPQDHPFAWYFDNQTKTTPQARAGAMTRAAESKAASVLGALPGHVWVTDHGQLGFLALDNKGGRGFYLADLEETNGGPAAVNVRKVLRLGDRLPDAPSAVSFNPGDVGANGTVAMRVETGDNGRVTIYVYKDGQLTPLLSAYQRVPSLFPHGRISSMLYGAISVHDDDSILLAPPLASAWEMNTLGQGLLFLPKGSLRDSRLVMHAGNLLPDTTSTVQTISSFQLHDEGRFVVMGTANPPAAVRRQVPRTAEGAERLTYLLTGSVQASSSAPRLLSAHGSLGISKVRASDARFASGTMMYNPRIGPDGTTAYIVRSGVGRDLLMVNGSQVMGATRDGSGPDRSPAGNVVAQLSAPVVGSDGHVYCVLGTNKGYELCIFNGTSAATILRTGDVIEGRTVVSIVMGLAARQVNRAGRIAFRVDYADMTSSLVLGDPV